jgi:hypothetical protein
MARWLLLAAVLLTACGSPEPVKQVEHDPTTEAWYGDTVKQLAGLNAKAKDLFHQGRKDDASALILQGEPLSDKLLAVTKPSLAAMIAAADLDELYGQMLLSNRNYGWARMFFQKNLARWRHWTPQNEETARRLREANEEIAECDKHIAQ